MAKTRTLFICQQCGRSSPKAMGRCPQCGAWNSMLEELESPASSPGRRMPPRGSSRPLRLAEIEGTVDERWPLPIGEVSRVLGGGVVPGSVVLIGGDPGIGKSTLMLQMALAMAADSRVLYVSGEESAQQIKSRAVRLSANSPVPAEFLVLAETNLEAILVQVEQAAARVVVIDSIQTVQTAEIESSMGSVSQVRESASRLQALAKSSAIAVFLVGHVTKDGAIAGPKVLEHLVDTVLYLEGDPYHAYRLLRTVKNRFGATTEVGVFEMRSAGMIEVQNPSAAFLAERALDSPGSAIAVTMEGTRPLLVEVQGLTSVSSFGNPRRTANGVDFNRLLLTLAVLTRRAGLRLGDQDVFVNVVGGMRIQEPAADLALALAIASSFKDRALPADLVLIGEVGLSGELRTVGQMGARLHEAAKLGFKKALIAQSKVEDWPTELEIVPLRTLRQALEVGLGAMRPS